MTVHARPPPTAPPDAVGLELDDAPLAAVRALRAVLRRNLIVAAQAPCHVPAAGMGLFEHHIAVQRLSVRGTTAAAIAVDEPTAAALARLALGAPLPRDAPSTPPLSELGLRLVARVLRAVLAEILSEAVGRDLDSELVAVRLDPHRASGSLVRLSLDVDAGAPLRFELFVGQPADL